MLKTRVINAKDIGQKYASVWREIVAQQTCLASPHFCPELAEIYGNVRPAAQVCVVEEGSEVIGLLPFHRQSRSQATAIGGHLSDFQGAIVRPGVTWDTREVLRRAGIGRIRFTNWVEAGVSTTSSTATAFESPYINLADGFEAYRAERRHETRELQEGLRKARKISRDLGPLRLEMQCQDLTVLTQLLHWKSEQMVAARQCNALEIPWTKAVFQRVLESQSSTFSGMLSALWVGDELIAATMGMRSTAVIHGWVTAYSPKFSRYSPGVMLILELAQQCEQLGIDRIDMGRGDESFKTSFASGSYQVWDGMIDADPIHAWLNQFACRAKESLRGSWLGKPLQKIVRRTRFAMKPLAESTEDTR
jgi:CelD/BcsL family acetyltransferase involved in cellulose biosynthesis